MVRGLILSSYLLLILGPQTCLSASPVNVTVSPEIVNVTIEQDETAAVTVTTSVGEVMNVITAGEQGIKGDKGDKGDPGDAGTNGTRGYDGREIELQTSSTHVQWRYLGETTWNNLVPLSAITGANGTNGKTVLNGSGAPLNSLGTDGDFYIDTDFAHLYGPKAAGAWPGTYTDLVGPQGEPGPPGASASITQPAVLAVLDDPTDGAVVWVQQGATEAATEPKSGTKDRLGNAKQWTDGNGTVVRQCIAADSAPAFKMLSSTGAVIYSVACDNTMTFTGTVTIK